MRKSETRSKQEEEAKFVFRASHFYELLEKQSYRCALTGRTLTPENTSAEHIMPLRKGGKHEIENIYLIDDSVAKLKRYFTEEEVIQLAGEILKYRQERKGI